MSVFTAMIVRRYLGSRRGFTRVVTAFSVIGIALGVAALLVVLAVMSGFRAELMGRILGVSGHATLEIPDLETAKAEALAAKLRAMPEVESAMPYVGGQVLLTADGNAVGAYLRGMATLPELIRNQVVLGGMSPVTDTAPLTSVPLGQVLLGMGLASNIGALPGGAVTMLAPEGARTPFGFIPRSLSFDVGGTFALGMVQFDNMLVLTNLKDAQDFFRRGDMVDALEIRFHNPQLANAMAPAIFRTAQEFADAPDISLSTWETTNGEFFRALQVERLTMFIILSLIVLVAAFNIITGQMMLVNDKLADIAILRTMGATKRHIQRIFFYNGMLLGGLGTLTGTALGMLVIFNMTAVVNGIRVVFGVDLFPRDVYFLSELPSKLSMIDLGAVLLMALILTVLASLYPAWRASQFNPVELLRRG
jgi:lipoprotein-releasing system permease protein